jgi:hypothetical protein
MLGEPVMWAAGARSVAVRTASASSRPLAESSTGQGPVFTHSSLAIGVRRTATTAASRAVRALVRLPGFDRNFDDVPPQVAGLTATVTMS